MKVIDMHCDTIGEIFKNDKLRYRKNSFVCNDLHIDIAKLYKGGYMLQNFALFVDLKKTDDAYEYCREMAEYYNCIMNTHKDKIKSVRCYKDIAGDGVLHGMLTVEEGECTKGEPQKLYELYRLGVRMMTLTWNYENSLGFPAAPRDVVTGGKLEPDFKRGLTYKGRLIVEEMMRLGMLVDVSHLSDGGFYDVLDISKAKNVPFVASHSNARSIAPNLRNLTDNMIREVGNAGGVIGLNFYPPFLVNENTSDAAATDVQFAYIIMHLRHMIDMGGLECVGLGSDFDGIDGELAISDASGMQTLYERLKYNGFSERELEYIFYKNVLRVYKAVL